MIFKDKLKEKTKILMPEFNRLTNLAWKNQAHIGDLLLLHINGFFDDQTLIWNSNPKNKKLNPHVIGPGTEGHSDYTHYKFIDKYRHSSIYKHTLSYYKKQIKWGPRKAKKVDQLTDYEETTIQLEMLIYLKFWEADFTIKKLYQFVRILNGEPYDWYFKVSESSRDKSSTGTRQDIILKKIRDRLTPISKPLYNLFKESYKTQIRNSIAHSNYSFLGRYIHLNNYIKEDPHSQLQVITFDEWIDIFHNTIVLQNEMIRLSNVINKAYGNISAKLDNSMEIIITEKNGKSYPAYLIYRPEYLDWHYEQ